MPTYEYNCKLCGRMYQEVRSIIEAELLVDCEDCHEPLIRKFGVQSIKFKGDGFYSNDKKYTIEGFE